MNLRLYAIVTSGGILGSLLRWAEALLIPATAGAVPWATLLANATGCFAIGFYAALTGPDGRLFVQPATRQFVMTGICGGYTTYSGFAVEMQALAAGDGRTAVLYLGLSIASWLAAVWLGDLLASRLNRLSGA